MIRIPKIALVGRPNVGKSTLFNRLVGERKAITDGQPGSTRDRNYGQCTWRGAAYELVDTGGLLMEEADPLATLASQQAGHAISEADLVVLLVDARAGLLPDDAAIAADLRRRGKRVVVAVNKCEARGEPLAEFASLGFEHMLAVSAEHGLGVGELLDTVLELTPRVPPAEEGETRPTRVALVGCPNVGKSSLLNRFLGTERAVVSEVPGTTRDSIDGLVTRDGKSYLFVDTAGYRRRAVLKRAVDQVSVIQTGHSIRRADVAIVVLDATVGVRETDVRAAGAVEEAGRGIVLAVNKWDGERARAGRQKEVAADVRERFKFVAHAPLVFVSAVTGRGMGTLLAAVDSARQSCLTRVTTGRLNRLLADAVGALPPRTEKSSGPVKLLYGTQIGTAPPTFALSLSRPVELHFSYLRYLENRIRAEFGFSGAPLVIRARGRRR
jgi:GTP-binding protein